jgi:hypothetical protein
VIEVGVWQEHDRITECFFPSLHQCAATTPITYPSTHQPSRAVWANDIYVLLPWLLVDDWGGEGEHRRHFITGRVDVVTIVKRNEQCQTGKRIAVNRSSVKVMKLVVGIPAAS